MKARFGSSPGSVLIVIPPLELVVVVVVGGVGRTAAEVLGCESRSHREFRRGRFGGGG